MNAALTSLSISSFCLSLLTWSVHSFATLCAFLQWKSGKGTVSLTRRKRFTTFRLDCYALLAPSSQLVPISRIPRMCVQEVAGHNGYTLSKTTPAGVGEVCRYLSLLLQYLLFCNTIWKHNPKSYCVLYNGMPLNATSATDLWGI